MTILLVVSDEKLEWTKAMKIVDAICKATRLECFIGTNGNIIFEEPRLEMRGE